MARCVTVALAVLLVACGVAAKHHKHHEHLQPHDASSVFPSLPQELSARLLDDFADLLPAVLERAAQLDGLHFAEGTNASAIPNLVFSDDMGRWFEEEEEEDEAGPAKVQYGWQVEMRHLGAVHLQTTPQGDREVPASRAGATGVRTEHNDFRVVEVHLLPDGQVDVLMFGPDVKPITIVATNTELAKNAPHRTWAAQYEVELLFKPNSPFWVRYSPATAPSPAGPGEPSMRLSVTNLHVDKLRLALRWPWPEIKVWALPLTLYNLDDVSLFFKSGQHLRLLFRQLSLFLLNNDITTAGVVDAIKKSSKPDAVNDPQAVFDIREALFSALEGDSLAIAFPSQTASSPALDFTPHELVLRTPTTNSKADGGDMIVRGQLIGSLVLFDKGLAGTRVRVDKGFSLTGDTVIHRQMRDTTNQEMQALLTKVADGRVTPTQIAGMTAEQAKKKIQEIAPGKYTEAELSLRKADGICNYESINVLSESGTDVRNRVLAVRNAARYNYIGRRAHAQPAAVASEGDDEEDFFSAQSYRTSDGSSDDEFFTPRELEDDEDDADDDVPAVRGAQARRRKSVSGLVARSHSRHVVPAPATTIVTSGDLEEEGVLDTVSSWATSLVGGAASLVSKTVSVTYTVAGATLSLSYHLGVAVVSGAASLTDSVVVGRIVCSYLQFANALVGLIGDPPKALSRLDKAPEPSAFRRLQFFDENSLTAQSGDPLTSERVGDYIVPTDQKIRAVPGGAVWLSSKNVAWGSAHGQADRYTNFVDYLYQRTRPHPTSRRGVTLQRVSKTPVHLRELVVRARADALRAGRFQARDLNWLTDDRVLEMSVHELRVALALLDPRFALEKIRELSDTGLHLTLVLSNFNLITLPAEGNPQKQVFTLTRPLLLSLTLSERHDTERGRLVQNLEVALTPSSGSTQVQKVAQELKDGRVQTLPPQSFTATLDLQLAWAMGQSLRLVLMPGFRLDAKLPLLNTPRIGRVQLSANQALGVYANRHEVIHDHVHPAAYILAPDLHVVLPECAENSLLTNVGVLLSHRPEATFGALYVPGMKYRYGSHTVSGQLAEVGRRIAAPFAKMRGLFSHRSETTPQRTPRDEMSQSESSGSEDEADVADQVEEPLVITGSTTGFVRTVVNREDLESAARRVKACAKYSKHQGFMYDVKSGSDASLENEDREHFTSSRFMRGLKKFLKVAGKAVLGIPIMLVREVLYQILELVFGWLVRLIKGSVMDRAIGFDTVQEAICHNLRTTVLANV